MPRPLRVTLVAVAIAGAIGWSTGSSASVPDMDGVTGAASARENAVRGERVVVAPPDPAPTTTTTTVPGGIDDPLLQAVLDLTNAERAKVGLPALTVNPLLSQAAQVHSEDQARRNTLTHYGVNGESPGDRIRATGYVFRTWAENAAMGYRTAESVMSGWMNSSGHRANILRATVTEIGLGLAYTPSGVPYWTQVFASPRN